MGGSSKRRIPGGISTPELMISRTVPRPERYVSQSISAGLTSSYLLNA
ncbi:MAG TPA: hypothetical protein VN886_14360 [Acidimicrobiales bacterium]|jgi:hypothetical protein|nr:hypothetical protein [Acidimicrobiales bacterium]